MATRNVVHAQTLFNKGLCKESRLSDRRVLIVEDDPRISSHLEALVSGILVADIVVSASTAEARATLATRPSFALLDVDVLDGTTYALASDLRSQGIPFAFVSASNRNHVPADLKSVPFIAKPYSNADITTTIKAALAESEPAGVARPAPRKPE